MAGALQLPVQKNVRQKIHHQLLLANQILQNVFKFLRNHIVIPAHHGIRIKITTVQDLEQEQMMDAPKYQQEHIVVKDNE
jgi:cell division protein FtsB